MSDYFLGEIRMFAFGRIPNGWQACAGQTLPIQQYAALFSLLGTTFGGNGTSNFGLPDLRGRTPYGTASTLPQGTLGGSESVGLTLSQLPPHTHGMFANASGTATPVDSGDFLGVNTNGGNPAAIAFKTYAPYAAATAVALASASVTPAGGSTPHENRQPSLTMSYCISTQGIYPSRS